jgi:hypothetical protein
MRAPVSQRLRGECGVLASWRRNEAGSGSAGIEIEPDPIDLDKHPQLLRYRLSIF